MLLLVFAHPYPDKSRANQALLEAVSDIEGLERRSLYDLYPGFDIDVPAEQEALARARVVIWQHPIYWYAPPRTAQALVRQGALAWLGLWGWWGRAARKTVLVGADHRR